MSLEVLPLVGNRTVVTNPILNQFGCISVNGETVPTIPLSHKVPLIRCIEDGASYKQNRLYILRADNLGYESVFPRHTHSPDDPFNEGGSFFDIRKENSHHLLDFNDQTMKKENFIVEQDEAGSTIVQNIRLNGSIYVQIQTNQVSSVNKGIMLYRGGLRLDFSHPFVLMVKQILSSNLAVLYRGGVNCAAVQSAAGVANQVCIEGCSSSNVNYGLRTGNGTSSTFAPSLNSNMAPADGFPKGYKIEYLPNDKAILTDSVGNQFVKDSPMPAINTGSDGDGTLRYGVITSSSTAKILKIYASHLIGKIYDTNSGIQSWPV